MGYDHSSQSACQAEGASRLWVVGETQISFCQDDKVFQFSGLIVDDLDVEVLAGTPSWPLMTLLSALPGQR